MTQRLQDDNGIIDFVDDNAVTDFLDDVGNATFGPDVVPVFPTLLLRIHAMWLLFVLIPFRIYYGVLS